MAGALREILARFGITADTRQLDTANRRVSSTRRSIQGLVAAAGGAATIMAMRRFVTTTIAMGDDLDKTAQQVGLTTRELQAFRHAAELSGVDAAAFTTAMGQLQLKAQQAARDGGQQARIFSDLGIEIRDASGEVLSGGELLRNVADAMQRTTNSSQRTAASMELMGRSGRRMLPMLTGGRVGLAAMEAELSRLGGGASADFIRQSVELTDDLTRLNLATTSLRATFLTGILPTMTRVVQWMTRTAASLSDTGAAAAMIRPILVALGVAGVAAGVSMAIAWGSAVAPILLAGAAAAIAYLAIDDLYMTATDDRADTLTRRLGDWAFGAGATAAAMGQIRQNIQNLIAYFEVLDEETTRAWRHFREEIDPVIVALEALVAQINAALSALGIQTTVGGIAERAGQIAYQASPLAGLEEAGSRMTAIGARHRARVAGGARADWEKERPSGTGARLMAGGPGFGTGAMLYASPPQQSVTVGPSTTTVTVNAAQNPEETARVVRREIDRRESARNRQVLAALEPARPGGE